MLCCALAVAAVPIARAQSESAPLLPSATAAAIAQELSGTRAKGNVQAITLHHRMRGSPGFEAAARFIQDRLRDYRLDGVEMIALPADGTTFYGTHRSRPAWNASFAELWEQSLEGGTWRDQSRIASYDEQPIVLAQDSISGAVSADLVDIGAGTSEEDYRGRDVRGKLVLTSSQPSDMTAMAIGRYGAAGIVSYARNQRQAWWGDDPTLIRWGHMGTFSDARGFAFMVTPARAGAWQAQLARGQNVHLRARVVAGQSRGSYLIPTAIIPGRDRSHEIVFSCHLDHQRPGANDNASGCAGILEIARALSALIEAGRIPRPARTLRFIWPAEIEGTLALLNARPEFARRTLTTFHLDMVGGNTEITKSVLRVYRSPPSLPSFVNDVAEAFARFVNRQSLQYADTGAADMPLVDPEGDRRALQAIIGGFNTGSDHQVWSEGSWRIPTVYIADWPDRYIHTNRDSVANIDATKLQRAMFIAAATAYYLATFDSADSQPLWRALREASVRRAAETMARAGALSAEGGSAADVANLWRFHFAYEDGVTASLGRYGPVPDALAGEMRQLNGGLRTVLATGAASPCPAELATGAIVYRRARSPRGTLDGMGYDYLADRLTTENLPRPALLDLDGHYGDAPYSYEALNLVDGRRTICEIRDDLSAINRPVSPRIVADYLQLLERLRLIERVR